MKDPPRVSDVHFQEWGKLRHKSPEGFRSWYQLAWDDAELPSLSPKERAAWQLLGVTRSLWKGDWTTVLEFSKGVMGGRSRQAGLRQNTISNYKASNK